MSARHVMLPHIGCADGNCIICKTLLNGNDLDNSYRDGRGLAEMGVGTGSESASDAKLGLVNRFHIRL